MATLIDSNNSTPNYSLYLDSTIFKTGQAVLGKPYILDSVSFFICKTGSPLGTVSVEVYEGTGTFGSSMIPTGDPIAVSDGIGAATLPTTAQYVDFTFSEENRIFMKAYPYLVFALVYLGLSDSDKVRCYYTANKHSGNMCYLTGAWNAEGLADLNFRLYGILPGPEVGEKYALPPFRRA